MVNIGISSYGLFDKYFYSKIIDNLEIFNDYDVHTIHNVDDPILNSLDLFLFDGGSDINPEIYNEANRYSYGINRSRDNLEISIFNKLVNRDTKFSGICRGLQLLNSLFGGTLFQDITSDLNVIHTASDHRLILYGSNLWLKNFISEGFYTNSMHHQAINKVGDTINVTLTSENDSIIEGIENEKLRAFQFHPEMMISNRYYDNYSDVLLNYLFWKDNLT